MTLDEIIPFEERREIAKKLKRKILFKEISKSFNEILGEKISEPGNIVNFDSDCGNITAIIRKIEIHNEKEEVSTYIQTINFSEWGKLPHQQTFGKYCLERVENYKVIGSIFKSKE